MENYKLRMDADMEIILTNMCMIYDNNGRILVQERKKKDWPGLTFPGGHVEVGEFILESVKREIKEETGLLIFSPELCGIKEWIIDGKRHLVILYRTCKFEGILQDSEEGRVFWIHEDDLLKYHVAPDTFEIYNIMKQSLPKDTFK